MDSTRIQQLSDYNAEVRNSSVQCVMRKPIPHKVSPRLASGYCDFNLKLHPVRYCHIHKGTSVTCTARTMNAWTVRLSDRRRGSMWTFLKPYFRKLHDIFLPKVYAAETGAESEKDKWEAQMSERIHESRGNIERPIEELADEVMRKETGWDRLQEMYGKYEGGPGYLSPEISNIIGVLFNAGIITAMCGYALGHMKCAAEFSEKHYHTKWPTRFKAARAYQDAVILAGAKFGGKVALRTVSFLAIWMLLSTSISVYRNKTGIIEHTVGGTTAGAVFGLDMGLKGIFARGVIGGAFGTVAGVVMFVGLSLNKDTQEQIRYWRIVGRLQEKREIAQMVEDSEDFEKQIHTD